MEGIEDVGFAEGGWWFGESMREVIGRENQGTGERWGGGKA